MLLEDRFFDQEFVQEMSNEDFRMLLYLLHFASKKTGIVELNMRMLNFSANTGRKYTVEDVLERFGMMLCLIPNKRTTAIFPSYIFINWMKNGIPENVGTHPLYKSIVKELASFGLTLEDVSSMAKTLKHKGEEGVDHETRLDDRLGDMDSRDPVMPYTGCLSPACDSVDSCSVLHRAVEGGLEGGKGTGQGTEGDGKGGEREETPVEVIDYDALFSEFWNAYPSECPRKVDRKKCRDKFVKILKGTKDPNETFKIVMAGLSVWKVCDTWSRDGGQYIRAPLVWLNGECWNDVPNKTENRRNENGNYNRKAVSANANVMSDDTEGLF